MSPREGPVTHRARGVAGSHRGTDRRAGSAPPAMHEGEEPEPLPLASACVSIPRAGLTPRSP